MKKFPIIAFAACVALAACTKNEVRPVSTDQEITFETAVYKASSKALISNATYPKTATFGTVAYKESTGKAKYFGPEEVSYNTTQHYWSTANAYYWPVNDALTFMSYSPFTYQESAHSSTAITVTDSYNQLGISDYDVAAHQETDLMVADIQKGQKANTTQSGTWQKGVPTIFHHKLSQIVAINFQTVDTQYPNTKKDYANGHDGSSEHPYVAGDQQFFINEVSLKNTCFKGSYSYVYDDSTNPATTTETWEKAATTETSTLWFTEPSGDPNTYGKFLRGEINPQRTSDSGSPATNNYILILPQTFEAYANKEEAPHIYIKYTVRTYYSASGFSDEVIEERVPIFDIHSDHTWAMNKKITYTFNLTKQRIYWDPSVTDWGTENHSVNI